MGVKTDERTQIMFFTLKLNNKSIHFKRVSCFYKRTIYSYVPYNAKQIYKKNDASTEYSNFDLFFFFLFEGKKQYLGYTLEYWTLIFNVRKIN